jgi:hypothetical protein
MLDVFVFGFCFVQPGDGAAFFRRLRSGFCFERYIHKLLREIRV